MANIRVEVDAGLTVEVVQRAPPVVIPPPVEPPPVVVPPPSELGHIVAKAVNPAKTLMLPGFMRASLGYDAGRYDRFQKRCVVSGARASLTATTNNFAAGGSRVPFGAALPLTLTFDGKAVASKTVAATDTLATFDVDLAPLAEGWYQTSVTGLDETWSVLDYAVYVLKGASAIPQSKMPVISGSYTMMFPAVAGDYHHHIAWVPAQYVPTILPLPARECPPFSTPPTKAGCVFTQLVHGGSGDTYRPVKTKDGVLLTANLQPYDFFNFQQPLPIFPLLDGPRGRGTLACPTHLEVGRAAPTAAEGNNLGPIGNTYFCDPWRVGKVRASGEVVTLAGWRHRNVPQYWEDPPTAELVGDWSAIPEARRGFNELWGMAWRVYPTDYAAAPIPAERNLRPHTQGVEAFVADQRRVMPNGIGRIVKLKFSPTSHSAPPVVTELNGDGWNQCFDVVSYGDTLYASDRMGHRIRVLAMDDGRVLDEWPVRMPEGLFLHERDDGMWLYYSTATRSGAAERGGIIDFAIRRRHLLTKEDVLVCNKVTAPELGYYVNGNTLLFKIAVSDGTFGPRGMVGICTWSNSYHGYPLLVDGETGKLINWLGATQGQKGLTEVGQTYTSAVGFGNGRMVWGSACDGLFQASQALPSDSVWPVTVTDGAREWKRRGYLLTHGYYGMGHYGLPLPWGVAPEIDTFLQYHGHTKPQ